MIVSFFAQTRSIAIDYLTEEFSNEKAKVVYMYFDYKAQAAQTVIYIVGTLLKQILCYSDGIPPELESFYDESVAKNKKPGKDDLVRFLVPDPRAKQRVYAVFDAFDECNESWEQDILSLFAALEKSGIKLLISSRPHLQFDQGQFTSVQNFVISADKSDLKNYILSTLKAKKNNSLELEKRCLDLIIGVDGM